MSKISLPENYGQTPSKKGSGGRPKKIEFSSYLEDSIFNIISINNVKYPDNKTDLDIAKRIVKRGLDSGNTDTALIRLRNFLLKKAGDSVSRYTDDDDLLSK